MIQVYEELYTKLGFIVRRILEYLNMYTPGVSGTLGTITPPPPLPLFTRNTRATSILQGTYNFTNIDLMTEIYQFLQALAILPGLQSIDPVDNAISTLHFQKVLVTKLQDKSFLSPSGCHKAHYKLLATDKGLSHTSQGYHVALSTWRLTY